MIVMTMHQQRKLILLHQKLNLQVKVCHQQSLLKKKQNSMMIMPSASQLFPATQIEEPLTQTEQESQSFPVTQTEEEETTQSFTQTTSQRPPPSPSKFWTCEFCTFINTNPEFLCCEMCNLEHLTVRIRSAMSRNCP